MENQIEKFDPSKLMEGVKDRIKSTFVSLIPDEMWEQMVEKEIYIFTTGKIVQHHEYKGQNDAGESMFHDWEERIPYMEEDIKDGWGNVKQKAEISPLATMIREELRKKFHDDLVAYLNGEDYATVRDSYGVTVISKAVEDIVVKNAGTIFRGVLSDMLQQGIQIMRAEIASQGGNNYRY